MKKLIEKLEKSVRGGVIEEGMLSVSDFIKNPHVTFTRYIARYLDYYRDSGDAKSALKKAGIDDLATMITSVIIMGRPDYLVYSSVDKLKSEIVANIESKFGTYDAFYEFGREFAGILKKSENIMRKMSSISNKVSVLMKL